MLVKAAEVGIAPWEFWEITWKEFQVMVLAAERTEVNGWRKTRFLGWLQYATNTTDKNKKSIEQFMPLPGDPKPKPADPKTILQTLKIFGSGRDVKN